MIFSRRDVNNVNQNVLLNVDSLVLTDHALAVMKSTKVIQSFESGAAQLSTPVQLCCCYVALLHRIIAASSVILFLLHCNSCHCPNVLQSVLLL